MGWLTLAGRVGLRPQSPTSEKKGRNKRKKIDNQEADSSPSVSKVTVQPNAQAPSSPIMIEYLPSVFVLAILNTSLSTGPTLHRCYPNKEPRKILGTQWNIVRTPEFLNLMQGSDETSNTYLQGVGSFITTFFHRLLLE